jgi:hypothetical protein
VIRFSIVRAFRDDGMRPHRGGGRVVAQARESFSGQVIGTGIRHDLQSSAVVHVAGRMVEATFSSPLLTRIRLARRVSTTAVAAVDVAPVVGLAAVENPRAARAANTHQNLDNIHARTGTAVLVELARLVVLGHLRPRQRPRATPKAQGSTPGPSSFAAETTAYPMD